MITQELPQGDMIVQALLVCFIVCITFTYPLSIFPCNVTLEHYTINYLFPHKDKRRFWAKNFSRFFICISAITVSIKMFSVLDKFLGLVGAIFCAPMAFIIPTMCHLKLVARTNEEKLKDIAIVAFSIMIMVFCVEQIISGW